MKTVPFPLDKRRWSPSPIPGPIALVSTCDAAGSPNLAPMSWIQMVSLEPPLLMLSTTEGSKTAGNILTTRSFGLNFADSSLAPKAFACVRWRGKERLDRLGLTLLPASKIKPPLVAECKARLECELKESRHIGAGLLIFAEIVAASHWDVLAAARRDERYGLLDQAVFLEDGLFAPLDRAFPAECGAPAGAGGSGSQAADRRFIRFVITLSRTSKTMTPDLVRRHVAHLKALDEKGRLVLCGPFKDGNGGMIILRASSREEARTIAESDPFVVEGAETVEVREWELSCRENNHLGMG